jgi:hypothetical protein
VSAESDVVESRTFESAVRTALAGAISQIRASLDLVSELKQRTQTRSEGLELTVLEAEVVDLLQQAVLQAEFSGYSVDPRQLRSGVRPDFGRDAEVRENAEDLLQAAAAELEAVARAYSRVIPPGTRRHARSAQWLQQRERGRKLSSYRAIASQSRDVAESVITFRALLDTDARPRATGNDTG